MCGCPAHHELVDCTCRCDHTDDRLSQWRARAKELEAQLAFRDQMPQLDGMGGISSGAVGIHELFQSYVAAGFKRREALALVQAHVHGNMVGMSFGETYAEAMNDNGEGHEG